MMRYYLNVHFQGQTVDLMACILLCSVDHTNKHRSVQRCGSISPLVTL